ncbi:MAG: NUDIX hydrolase [Bacteroidetes bacterium]|nr:NUDIX hydrolase [Bacteroidota bacterium]
MEKRWQTLQSKKVYENPWIEVHHCDVIAPTGKKGIYGKVHYKNYAIGILPVDDMGNTWLIGQHRYPLDEYTWEIPEGGGVIGQDILAAAKRELEEEAGLKAACWEEIQRLHLSNSVSDEIGIIFLATHLNYVDVKPDETEVLTIRKMHLTEAIEMLKNGEITDTMSVVALMHASVLLEQNII